MDLFYTKVLADKRVNFFFEDVSMKRQHNKQKQFLSAALGSPVPYTGMDMRKGHKHLDLTEAQCNRRESGSHTGGIESELTPENTAAFCVRFQGQNQGTRHERKETQDRGNYSYSADG